MGIELTVFHHAKEIVSKEDLFQKKEREKTIEGEILDDAMKTPPTDHEEGHGALMIVTHPAESIEEVVQDLVRERKFPQSGHDTETVLTAHLMRKWKK